MNNQNQSRRNFLKLFGAAAVVAVAVPSVVLLQPIKPDNSEWLAEMEVLLAELTRKFDRYSATGKQKFIDSLDGLGERMEAEYRREFSDEVGDCWDELKAYYEDRFAKSLNGKLQTPEPIYLQV